MVHYMDHDYMVQNINEYIVDVYIYMHTAKYKIIKHFFTTSCVYIYQPLYMVYIIHHISFCIENEHNVFDSSVNMVDN